MIDLSSISTIDLIREIRRRQLADPLEGTLTIKPDSNIEYSINNLLWPAGRYKVKIILEEDLTEKTNE